MRNGLKDQGFFERSPRRPFGTWTAYDLEECERGKVKDTLTILKFFQSIEDAFQLKEQLPPSFGRLSGDHVEGSYFFHLLRRAHLVGYFLEETSSAYIDIFTSADQPIAASGISPLVKQYFNPLSYTIHAIRRA